MLNGFKKKPGSITGETKPGAHKAVIKRYRTHFDAGREFGLFQNMAMAMNKESRSVLRKERYQAFAANLLTLKLRTRVMLFK